MIVRDRETFEARINVVEPCVDVNRNLVEFVDNVGSLACAGEFGNVDGVKGDIFEPFGDGFCFGNAGVGEMNVNFGIGIVKAGDVVISLTVTDDIEVHSKPLSEFLLARTNTSVSWVIFIIY